MCGGGGALGAGCRRGATPVGTSPRRRGGGGGAPVHIMEGEGAPGGWGRHWGGMDPNGSFPPPPHPTPSGIGPRRIVPRRAAGGSVCHACIASTQKQGNAQWPKQATQITPTTSASTAVSVRALGHWPRPTGPTSSYCGLTYLSCLLKTMCNFTKQSAHI